MANTIIPAVSNPAVLGQVVLNPDGSNVGGGPGGGGAATIADGADVAEGAVADAMATVGGTGTLSAKLRRITQGLEDLKSLIVLGTSTNKIGNIGTLDGSSTAHGAVDSGNPLKVGAIARGSLKALTLVADGQRTNSPSDLDGLSMVRLNTSLADLVSERVADTAGTATAFANFSAVAGLRNYVTTVVVFNSSATAGYVDFRDGTGGAVLYTVPLPAGSGAVIASAVPLFKTSVATALAYDVSAALTTVYISVSGFQSKGG